MDIFGGGHADARPDDDRARPLLGRRLISAVGQRPRLSRHRHRNRGAVLRDSGAAPLARNARAPGLKRGLPPKRKMPLRSESEKRRADRLSGEWKRRPQKPLPRTTKPIKKTGKHAWVPPEPAGVGICLYRSPNCTAARAPGKLTWDHVVMRSVLPTAERDAPANLVRACATCNSARGAGYKPPWGALPQVTRDFVLRVKSSVFCTRYFTMKANEEKVLLL